MCSSDLLLRQQGAPAGLLATAGVLVTSGVVAAAAVWALGMTWPQGALLGAIVSSTDAAAVFAQFSTQAARLPTRLSATIEIESGLNDPMAVFLTLGLLGWLQQPDSSATDALWLLVRQLGWGMAVGVAAAVACAAVLRRLPLREDHNGLTALLLAALGCMVFAVAGLLEGSGFLAVYLFGALLAHRAPQAVRPALAAVNGFTWLSQATMFLLLGLLVTPHEVWRLILPSLLIAGVLMLLARPLAVVLCLTPLGFPWREQAFVASVGLRGAVPIVLAMFPWLAGLDQAYLYFDIAFVVVLCSLVLQAPVLGALARWLGLQAPAPVPPVGQDPHADAAPGDGAAGGSRLQ